MDKLTRNLTIGLVVLIAMVGAILYLVAVNTGEDVPFGSTVQGNEYNYNQFTGAISTTTLICSNGCVLGSVIITEDFAGTLIFKKATSTTAYAKTNATQIVDMQSALTEGTYIFDVYVPGYLYMVSADGFSFAGDITVTWRD